MAMPAPQSAAMERQVSRPYINNNTAPSYSNREEAIKHQSATIAYIEQCCMYSGPRLNTTHAADTTRAAYATRAATRAGYTTHAANEPSSQLHEPEDSTSPGQAGTEASSSPEPCSRMTAALTLLQFSQRAVVFPQDRAQRAMAQPEPNHGSPASRSLGDEALAPGDSTKGKLEVPQQHAPQQGQGQGQGQQGPREFKRTGEDDGHTDGSASSVLTTSGSRRPLPNYKPQPNGKRKRVEEEEPEQEKEKESGTKRTVKEEGRKSKQEKEYKLACHCGRPFKRNDHLTRHQETHYRMELEGGGIGFKRLQCNICGKPFTRKDNLQSHRNTVHGVFGHAPPPKFVWVDAQKKIIANARVLGPRLSQQTARPELAEPISGSSSPLKQDQEGEQIQKANNK